jgi:hypothetical protein
MTRLVALVSLVLVLAAEAALAAEATPPVVRYEQDRLTVRVTDMPLDRLLAEIAAVTHATIRGDAPSRTGSFDFTAVSLREGLTHVLGAESFMLTYASDGTLRAIELLGKGVPVAMAPSPRPSGSPRAEEEPPADVLQRRIAIPPALAKKIGSETAPIGRVLRAAVHERDASLRAAAQETALDALRNDPELEAALSRDARAV